MEFTLCENIIGALTIELVIEVMKDRDFIQIARDNGVSCSGNDWRNVATPLWISSEFFGAARIDRSSEDTLFGRVNIFRVRDLTWRNEDPDFDDHRAVARVEFLLPKGFKIADAHHHADYVTADDEFTGPIINDLFAQTHCCGDLAA